MTIFSSSRGISGRMVLGGANSARRTLESSVTSFSSLYMSVPVRHS